jgi:quercetin dioxygenase-like cupin family protein
MSARQGSVRFLDLSEGAAQNKNFFTTVCTTQQTQIVYGHLMPGERVDEEVHHYSTQVVTVATGTLRVFCEGRGKLLMMGDTVVISAGIRHELRNDTDEHASFWSIYSPPVHKPGEMLVKKNAGGGDDEEEDAENPQ